MGFYEAFPQKKGRNDSDVLTEKPNAFRVYLETVNMSKKMI